MNRKVVTRHALEADEERQQQFLREISLYRTDQVCYLRDFVIAAPHACHLNVLA